MLRLITILALALLIGRIFVVATSRRAPPRIASGPTEIEMSVWGMPWESDLYTQVYLPEFERENPGIHVRFHHFEDYSNRILLSHAGGIAPDVIRENIDFSMGWIRRGLNLPLDRYMDSPDGIDRNDFIPILWQGLTYRGRTYGVPQDINILGLFYNKALFDRAGLKYPDENWTWADLKSASEKLTRTDRNGHVEVVGFDVAWGGWSYRPFLYQAGAHCWDKDGTRTAIDTPQSAAALRFYRSLMHHYSLTESNDQRGGLGPDKFFEQGKVALYIDGTWRTPSLKKNAPDLRFGVAPLPRGVRPMSVSSSCFWGVSSQTKHPDAAWKLVKFLSSKEALTRYWQYLWVAPPARWSSLRSPEFRRVAGAPGKIPGISTDAEFDEKCGWISKALERGWTTVEGCGPYNDLLMLHLNEAVDKVLLEGADPATALHAAARATDDGIRASESTEEAAR